MSLRVQPAIIVYQCRFATEDIGNQGVTSEEAKNLTSYEIVNSGNAGELDKIDSH
jgi:hypothetical protein